LNETDNFLITSVLGGAPSIGSQYLPFTIGYYPISLYCFESVLVDYLANAMDISY